MSCDIKTLLKLSHFGTNPCAKAYNIVSAIRFKFLSELTTCSHKCITILLSELQCNLPFQHFCYYCQFRKLALNELCVCCKILLNPSLFINFLIFSLKFQSPFQFLLHFFNIALTLGMCCREPIYVFLV